MTLVFSNAARALRATFSRLNDNEKITVFGVSCVSIAILADSYSAIQQGVVTYKQPLYDVDEFRSPIYLKK